MLLRPLGKAAKPATLSCQQSHKFRLGCSRVLLRLPASCQACIAELTAASEGQAELLQGAAEAAGLNCQACLAELQAFIKEFKVQAQLLQGGAEDAG